MVTAADCYDNPTNHLTLIIPSRWAIIARFDYRSHQGTPMQRIFRSRLITIALLALVLGACASTKPIGEWRDASYGNQLDNLLIIGVTTRSTRRRVFEDRFVDALAARGVKAVASYTLITSTINLEREQVQAAIRGQNINAVLVTRLTGVEREKVYSLPSSYDYYRDFNGYYDHVLQQTNTGYYAQYRVLTLETNLWDAATGELIWQLQSQAIDASQPRHVIEDQINLAIDTLAKRGLIAAGS